MQPTELRIGNKLHFRYDDSEKWKEGTVGAIPMDFCDDYNVAVEEAEDNCDVEPIPLTEEWLKKFDFEKSELNNYHEKIPLLAWVEEDKITMDHAPCGYHEVMTRINDIQYVHQLQNLYHSLTGKEL